MQAQVGLQEAPQHALTELVLQLNHLDLVALSGLCKALQDLFGVALNERANLQQKQVAVQMGDDCVCRLVTAPT